MLLVWGVVRVTTARGLGRMAFGTLVAGGLLNALPILLNGAMPYRASARALGDGLKGTPISDDTVLPMLGDVIQLPAGKLVSLGDLVLAVGATLDVYLVMRVSQRLEDGGDGVDAVRHTRNRGGEPSATDTFQPAWLIRAALSVLSQVREPTRRLRENDQCRGRSSTSERRPASAGGTNASITGASRTVASGRSTCGSSSTARVTRTGGRRALADRSRAAAAELLARESSLNRYRWWVSDDAITSVDGVRIERPPPVDGPATTGEAAERL